MEQYFVIPQGVFMSAGLDTSFVAHCAFFIACILAWATLCGWLLYRAFGIPTIAGQIIGGIALGPSGLHIAGWTIFVREVCFTDYGTATVYSVVSSDLCIFFIVLLSSVLTVSYLLWVAGYETDVADIAKVGSAAISAGFLGAVLPIVSMWIGLSVLGSDWFSLIQSVGVGLIFAATSVSIPVAMLFSMRMMHLRSSKATLGAAIIDDIVAVILLSTFFVMLQSGFFGMHEGIIHEYGGSLFHAVGYLVFSFAVIFSVGAYGVPLLIRWLGAKSRAHLVPAAANALMLMYFAFAELVGGLAGITGAYFAGLFHRKGGDHGHAQEIIAPFAQAVLLPLFLGSIGLQLDIRVLSISEWGIVFYVLVLAVLSKMLACFFAVWISNWGVRSDQDRWSWVDGFMFGSCMVARGEVGLVVATVLRGALVITQEQYVIAVVAILLTTIASPILLASALYRLNINHDSDEFNCTIGPFLSIGTTRMFEIIVAYMQNRQTHMNVSFSQGRQIIALDGERVKIILCPQEGIVFQGDKRKIESILIDIRSLLIKESERLFPSALQK